MDSQNTSFLPPPIDGEASAPLAQPDDDFVVPLSAAGTPNTPATDGDTGSTVSPVSPVHLNRGPPPMMMMMDDNLLQNNGNAAADDGATDDGTGLLPPLDEVAESEQERSEKDTAVGDSKNDQDENNDDDDDQVPVLAMSSILPATATGGDAATTDDTKKPASGGTGTANGDNKSKDKSCFTTGNAAGGGTDTEDSGTNNQQAPLGCGTTFEYVVLITACTILLLAVTGTTVYWTMAYRGGYDSGWFPWPPQTPKQLLSVGVFTYKHMQNLTTGNMSTTTTTTTIATSVEPTQLNSSIIASVDERRFNLHPTLMTAGFVTLTGFSILVYRMAAGCPTSCRGTYVKLTHGLLHLITVPCVILGSVAAMEYHRLKGLPHLYSLHSWMGFMTVSLFVIQFTLGFFTFVVLLCCRGATAVCRLRCFAPIHAALGLCTFTLAIGTCLTGLQQRADYTIFNNNGQQQSKLYHREVSQPLQQQGVINIIGILLMMALVFVTTTLLSLRRKTCRRYSSSDMRYCSNGGQTFQLVPSATTVVADGLDHNGYNGRIDSESIKEKIHMNKEPVVVNVLAVLLVFVLIIVSYTVRRESIKRRSNNRPSYTGTVSPMRIKSSSSTGKFGSGKQSTQLPI